MTFARITVIAYYFLAVLLSVSVVFASNLSVEAEARLADRSSADQRTRSAMDRLAGALSLGYYDRDVERTASQNAIAESAMRYRRWSIVIGAALMLLSVAFLVSLTLPATRSELGGSALVLHGLGVSGVFLAIGLTAPVLTLVAFKEIPILGEVVLSFEVKSVLAIAGKLFTTGNVFIGVLLVLFSLLIPGGKLVLSWLALVSSSMKLRRASRGLIHHLGKWSMADVFVVAVLLSFLASNTQETTDARLGVGFYFFAGYALLSLAVGRKLLHAWDEPTKPPGGLAGQSPSAPPGRME